jgi:thiol-disulfide isomerase/thioredoxin
MFYKTICFVERFGSVFLQKIFCWAGSWHFDRSSILSRLKNLLRPATCSRDPAFCKMVPALSRRMTLFFEVNEMAETPSTMLPLGTIAPDFTLMDVRTDKMMTLRELKSDVATVVMFICNHCPYVKLIQDRLAEVAKHYQTHGVSFIAINSNDVQNYPADAPDKMKIEAEKHKYSFPYLFDETQQVAKAYQAACTPDFYIFDKNLACVYRGRFDEATPGNKKPVTGEDLCHALDNILTGKLVSANQKPSVGCNIKWKK